MTHVRIASWDDDPPDGGQGVVVRELRAALVARGLQVSTTSARGPAAMRYQRLSGHGPLDMSVSLNIFPGRLLTGSPDVVLVSGGPGGLQLLRRLPVPMVYLAHHTFRLSHPRYHLQRAYSPIEGLGYRRAEHVGAVSPSTAHSVIEMGVPPAKVSVISPGIELEGLLAPEGTARQRGRMIFLGRLCPEKGVLDAIAAMAQVIREEPGSSGVVVGSGPQSEEVRSACSTKGAGRISYLGPLSHDQLREQLWQAEVMLVPSQFEGLGLVALEAMAAGVAVVGYDVIGLRDTIGKLGRMVTYGNVTALARAVLGLLGNDSERQELVASALETVRRERSWASCAQAWDEVFDRVLGR